MIAAITLVCFALLSPRAQQEKLGIQDDPRHHHLSYHAFFPPHRRNHRRADNTAIAQGRADAQLTSDEGDDVGRGRFVRNAASSSIAVVTASLASVRTSIAAAAEDDPSSAPPSAVVTIEDPDTYSAAAYLPPAVPSSPSSSSSSGIPLLVVLPGAGTNLGTADILADIRGEHAGLPPSLLASGRAPRELSENFAVVAPHVGEGKRNLYDEPRGKVLRFVEWMVRAGPGGGVDAIMKKNGDGRAATDVVIDPNRVFLLGFSEGATLAIELATTRRFRGVIAASYGFTGTLPPLAVERLRSVPGIWVFHSADDVIYPVECSDKLVVALKANGGGMGYAAPSVKYSRFDSDPEGFSGDLRGHTTGITASKSPEVYSWLLSLK